MPASNTKEQKKKYETGIKVIKYYVSFIYNLKDKKKKSKINFRNQKTKKTQSNRLKPLKKITVVILFRRRKKNQLINSIKVNKWNNKINK